MRTPCEGQEIGLMDDGEAVDLVVGLACFKLRLVLGLRLMSITKLYGC